MWSFRYCGRARQIPYRKFIGKLLLVFYVFANLWFVNYATTESSVTDLEKVGGTPEELFCLRICDCVGPDFALQVDCSNRSLTAVPSPIKGGTVKLYLSDNNITRIENSTFQSLPHLNELNIANNNITFISPNAFSGLSKLKSLSLQNNDLSEIPAIAFEPLNSLEALHLDDNRLVSVPAGSLKSLRRLQRLWLNGNQLRKVPTDSLRELPELEALNLGDNKIESIPESAFFNSSKLVILMLHRNEISDIDIKGFVGLTSLKVLEIYDNKLMELPFAISSLPTLRELVFSRNAITELSNSAFHQNPKLTLLEMGGNPITTVGARTFAYLPNLKTLTVSEARQMKNFPDLTGTSALEHLRLDRASLSQVPRDLCVKVPLLRSLNLRSNSIDVIPDLKDCKELRLIDFSYNKITTLDQSPFLLQSKLVDLYISHNFIPYVPQDAFLGLQNLQILDLSNNDIEDIHPLTFLNMTELKDLNLGNNRFPRLPTAGLQNLRQLKTHNNKNLREFPLPEQFPKVHTLALSYAYHCCMFRPLARRLPLPASLQETIVWLTREDVDMNVWSTNITDVWPGYENFSSKFEEFASQLWKTFGRDHIIPDNLAQFAEEYFQNYKISHGAESSNIDKQPVQCMPEPGPFMPCEDLFGWWSLRCGVWVVFLLAMLGNGVVVIVLLFGRSKIDVPRFLVCNLAMADFFMGIYLGILAVVDASTLGEFRIYAIQWQMSAGCQIAGFLGVLSSELSVYTLAVITLERNYAITHAMHLNKRLSLKHAGYIMSGGWIFALLMALLPLFGVSDYRKFAVCLPFETEDIFSMSYVVFIMFINGVAFLTLMGCYLKMYWVIRGSQAWNSNDSRIAKRMALLVITDFVCWAPIAFFSLTAVFGANLISLEEAKVFTIFVLPLNSCANPFLYAIFTKQFKKDCVLICKRIEESRVTRGIGRCRHSSNFSNRHTPQNTNSAAERKSGGSVENQPICQCGAHLKPTNSASKTKYESPHQSRWKTLAIRYLTCHYGRNREEPNSNEYSRAVATRGFIHKSQDPNQKRQSSISSENFSSRSDSWRQGNIPLKLLERGTRRNSWTGTQKSSQDSSNSCSRQDSSTSTFRLSRSSVSSDASSSRPGYSSVKERGPGPQTHNFGKPPSGSNGDLPPRFSRSATNVKDTKPKLCRQGAVFEDLCQYRHHPVTTTVLHGRAPLEMPLARKSPPVIPMKRGVCTTCGRREISNLPTRPKFKNKELEEKFNCFYNRLVETSNEESSEANTSKDDRVLSTDQSTGDPKTDSGKETVDTSLSEQASEDFDSLSPVTKEPPIFSEVPKRNSKPRLSLSGYKAPPAVRTSPNMFVSCENMSRKKSRSMSHLGLDFKLFSRRKAISDNSLKKISLKSLPRFLRSLSSQSAQSSNSQKAMTDCSNKSQLLPYSTRPILACKSEVTIVNRSPEASCSQVWSPVVLAASHEGSDDGDIDADDENECSDVMRDNCETESPIADMSQAAATSQQLPLRGTNSTTSEDTPLIDKEVKPTSLT